MNTGQMLITIGAIFLLSLVILRVNTNLFMTDNVLDRSKIDLMATSLATSAIQEATSKAFDEVTKSGNVINTGSLTPVANLGIETGESYPLFDDIDDFNYFKNNPKIDTIFFNPTDAIYFETFYKVDYVNENSPETVSSSQTWNKRLVVKVTSNAMIDDNTGLQDTMKLSTIFSYWFFE